MMLFPVQSLLNLAVENRPVRVRSAEVYHGALLPLHHRGAGAGLNAVGRAPEREVLSAYDRVVCLHGYQWNAVRVV